MELFWVMGLFFIFVFVAFVVFAVFLPEWIGITGAKAREVMKEQSGEAGLADPPEQGRADREKNQ